MCVQQMARVVPTVYENEGVGPLCHKMRRYGPTVQVREELRLDSLCTVDGEGGVHCTSKCRGIRPLLHKMRRYGPTVQLREELRLQSVCP